MSTATDTAPHAPGADKPHLTAKPLIGYGMGDAGCNIAFQMTGLFLLVFYTNVVGIKPEHSSLIFLFIKIWDAFADIFAGRMVDATMTRWGKFRPFILWYSVPLLASNLLCFWIPVDDYWAKVSWAAFSYALMGLLYSMVNIPYGSLAGAMSQNPVDRSRMASARMVGSGFTILVLAVLLAPAIKAAGDLQRTFLLTAVAFLVIGTIFFMTTFLTSKEVVFREVEKVSLKETIDTVKRNGPLMRLCGSSLAYLTGQNVVSATALYIAIDLLGRYSDGNWQSSVVTVITTGAVLYMGPFGPVITRQLGKKRGFLVAGTASIVGLIIFWLGNAIIGSLWICLLGLFTVGASMAILNTMTWALEADTVEYGEYRTGIRTEGATYAAFSFTRKVGQGIGMAMAGWVLALAGYVQPTETQKAQGISHIQQTPAVLDSMALWFIIFAGACFIIAVAVMWSYPLTEARFAQIMESIERNRGLRHVQYGGEKGGYAPKETLADRPGGLPEETHPADKLD